MSNLHIAGGTPVYTFVLEQNTKPDLYYAHSGLYTPCLVSFNSTYNDYGGGEDCTGDAIPYILDSIAVNSIDEFFDKVHEGTLKFNSNQIYHSMMRKDIVDDMLQWYKTDYRNISFNDCVSDVRDMLSELIKRHESDIYFSCYMDIPHIKNNRAAVMLESQANHIGFSRIVDVFSIVDDAIKSSDKDSVYKLEALIIDFLRGIFVNAILDKSRKQWTPGSSVGSQSYSGDILLAIGESIKKVVDKENSDFDFE